MGRFRARKRALLLALSTTMPGLVLTGPAGSPEPVSDPVILTSEQTPTDPAPTSSTANSDYYPSQRGIHKIVSLPGVKTPGTGVQPVSREVPEPPPRRPKPERSLKDRLSDQRSSGYGGVKRHVAQVGHLIQAMFDVDSVGGKARRARASDHPKGLALDFMVDRATGDRIAKYLLANKGLFKVKYVIWRQRINYGTGWSGMEDRGGATANHFDHVHVSFHP